ncbi:tRNA nucleotidyltransferase [Angomonas deanei]|nr:tRNA nucleotidyltransferase [Angomonas deanei]EPY40343.1 tRNA nucleotidyltransferase [Angomonas deanei]|eukprot:EPY34494.1 tRNA nucleotidyltransferase [Angomonas deanei]
MLRQPKMRRLDAQILPAHQKVFECLLNVNREKKLGTVLRVAGGWVRDTLLGLNSHDIDIAIESSPELQVSGERFAKEVSLYQGSHGERERTVSVIRVNPDLSKHIETATVNVYDLPIEFCALRTDDYCEDSRIPLVRPGTPLEDALRRDYTINALFFNLHTEMIEDYTTGLEDLDRRVIRCPLEPRQTFSDDPLRLLRGIRFSGQLGSLGFSIDDSIRNCVDQSLLDILMVKVSRDRIGKEFTKMLSGPRPGKCVQHLFEMGIMAKIILVEIYMKAAKKKAPKTPEIEKCVFLLEMDGSDVRGKVTCLSNILAPLLETSFPGLHSDDRFLAFFFSLVVPFYRGLSADDLRDRLYALCLNGLKLPTSVFNATQRMICSYNQLLSSDLKFEHFAGGELSNETKLIIFDALGVLHDASVPQDCIKLVLLVFFLFEERADVLSRQITDECSQLSSVVWGKLDACPSLLRAHDADLPIKGNQLKDIVNIQPKQIGPILLQMRKELMLNPSLSREDLVTWLQTFSNDNSV